ncbi:MAG: lipocalin-like domain-containing protein [Gammaproteobacteria bacterium]
MRFLLIILFIPMLFACQQLDNSQSHNQSVTLAEGMGGKPKPGFARAIKPREFLFPQDHGPHPEYATEWWYFTGNLKDKSSRLFGYQLTIFRVGLDPKKPLNDSSWRTNQLFMGHLAISDIDSKIHESAEIFSRAAMKLAGSSREPFSIWLGPWSIQSQGTDFFPLKLKADYKDIGIDLLVQRGDRPLVLQGNKGLSQKGAEAGNASYYYSYTRLPTSGTIVVNAETFLVTGNSWFDREWSSSALADDQQGWDWFALQLDDGRDLMFYRMRGKDGKAQKFSKGILVENDGNTVALDLENTLVEPLTLWTDPSGHQYPVKWRLRIDEHNLNLVIEAFFNDQLMQHTVNYWEGAVKVGGSHSGRGYMELSGYANTK